MPNSQFAKKNNWQETDTPLKEELDRMDTGIQNLYDAANIFEFHCTGEQDDVTCVSI